MLDRPRSRTVRADVDDPRARLENGHHEISGGAQVNAGAGLPLEVAFEMDAARKRRGGLAGRALDQGAALGGGDLEAFEHQVSSRSRRERKVLERDRLFLGNGAQPRQPAQVEVEKALARVGSALDHVAGLPDVPQGTRDRRRPGRQGEG